jgi:hypothetical protein
VTRRRADPGALVPADADRVDAPAPPAPARLQSTDTAFGTVALSRGEVLARLAPPEPDPRVLFAERYDLRITESGARASRDRNGLFFAKAAVEIDLVAIDDMHTSVDIRAVRRLGPVEIAVVVVPLVVLVLEAMIAMPFASGYMLRVFAMFMLLATGARRYRAWVERRRLGREIRARLAAFVVPDRPLELPYRKGPAQLPMGERSPP